MTGNPFLGFILPGLLGRGCCSFQLNGEYMKKQFLKEWAMVRVLKAIAAFFRRATRGCKGRATSYRCSKCGELGHNRATCAPTGSYVETAQVRVPQKRRCSVCRQTGHDKRKCRSRSALKTASRARSAIKISRGLSDL